MSLRLVEGGKVKSLRYACRNLMVPQVVSASSIVYGHSATRIAPAPAPFCQKRNQPSMTHRDGEKREWSSELGRESGYAIFFSQTSRFALKLGKRIQLAIFTVTTLTPTRHEGTYISTEWGCLSVARFYRSCFGKFPWLIG